MDINEQNNIINQISNMSDEQRLNVDITFHLVNKQKQSDYYYDSKEIALEPDVVTWLKKNITTTLSKLKLEDEDKNKTFFVSDYNHELKKSDNIARYNLVESQDLLTKKGQLVTSVRSSNDLFNDNNTNFQVVKARYDSKEVYFCYYRGIKKNTSNKKKFAIKNSNRFKFIEDTVIDMGGNIDFILVDDYIFIISNRNFEFAFDYTDHVNQKRNENLNSITAMSFFQGENCDVDGFMENCKKYIYSRSLAQINESTLLILQDKFIERCKELKKIKKSAPKDAEKKKQYIEKLGTLWELLEYIDVDNNVIIYKSDMAPTPLIHFFADKIVKSFLSEDIKVALAFE